MRLTLGASTKQAARFPRSGKSKVDDLTQWEIPVFLIINLTHMLAFYLGSIAQRMIDK